MDLMSATRFDDLTDVYDALIDWPKRLAHEEPFYRRQFERCGARRVLDAACGGGRHAAMFHEWGLDVEASDLSPAMIARAKAQFGEPPGLRFVVRGFDQPAETAAFDVAVCVGNSLSLAPDLATVERTLHALLAAVRPGGLVIVHVLNLWALPDGPCVWQKNRRTSLPQGERLVVKGLHRCGVRGYVELILADPAGGPMQSESVPFLGLDADTLSAFARQAGAEWVEVFGGYAGQAYEREKSVDLVLVAGRKSGK